MFSGCSKITVLIHFNLCMNNWSVAFIWCQSSRTTQRTQAFYMKDEKMINQKKL